jgi:hypothetical protein
LGDPSSAPVLVRGEPWQRCPDIVNPWRPLIVPVRNFRVVFVSVNLPKHTRRVGFVAHPSKNLLCVLVNCAHLLHLVISLRSVVLIDAQGVYPNRPHSCCKFEALAFSLLKLAQTRVLGPSLWRACDPQELVETFSYLAGESIDEDVAYLAVRPLYAPYIRQAGVCVRRCGMTNRAMNVSIVNTGVDLEEPY